LKVLYEPFRSFNTPCAALERPAVIAGIFVFAHDGRMGARHFRHVGCNPFGSAI
jgi:hypothetical protein